MHWIRWGMTLALVAGACTSEETSSTGPSDQVTGESGPTTRGSTTSSTTAGGTTGTPPSSGSDGTDRAATSGGTATGDSAAVSGTATGGAGEAGAGGTGGSTSTGAGGGGGNNGGSAGSGPLLPEANAPFDYQIGGSYAPPAGVRIVSRDREDSPAPDLYNICYVNGFQTQPQDNDEWLSERAELILHDDDGEPVFDEDWGEYLFDTRTPEKQIELLETVGDWIAGCARDGFDAVEIDNLDSYTRSGGLVTEDDNVSFMARLAAVAHEHDLAIGQKNSAELVPRARELGTDFVVAEECNRYDECAYYQAHYGNLVFVIEYREQDFQRGCSDFPELSIVLRDLNVTTPGSSRYVFDGC